MVQALIMPTEMLKTIHSNVSSTAMGLKSILISIKDKKATIKHVNATNSALLRFTSVEFHTGSESFELPIDTDDLKTIVGLAKDVPDVTFMIDDGVTTCKIGKIKKQFAQPKMDRPPQKDPKFETTVSMSFNDAQAAELVASFSDLKEMGDLKIDANEEGIVFKVAENNRYTKIEFPAAEITGFNMLKAATAGYDLDMAVSLFKARQKNSSINFEFGADLPLKVEQKTTQGTLSVVLAPKIYD